MKLSTKNERTKKEMVYNHASWDLRRKFLRFLIRTIAFTLMVKLDKVEGLDNVPSTGAAILLINHIGFVDPIVVLHIISRNIIPLAKLEVYEYPIIGIFPKLWGVVPVKRDSLDRRAVKKILNILNAGEIILIAPEGTRNDNLQEGREGIAYFASRTGAPIIPVAIEGTEGFPTHPFSSRWRKSGAYVRFGTPFHFKPEILRPKGDLLRKMTDEAMYKLAEMLPEHRRGVYSNVGDINYETIDGSVQ